MEKPRKSAFDWFGVRSEPLEGARIENLTLRRLTDGGFQIRAALIHNGSRKYFLGRGDTIGQAADNWLSSAHEYHGIGPAPQGAHLRTER